MLVMLIRNVVEAGHGGGRGLSVGVRRDRQLVGIKVGTRESRLTNYTLFCHRHIVRCKIVELWLIRSIIF